MSQRVAAPVSIIYNGIEPERSLPSGEAAPERVQGGRFELCYIGSLIPRKRVDVLLRISSVAESSVLPLMAAAMLGVALGFTWRFIEEPILRR